MFDKNIQSSEFPLSSTVKTLKIVLWRT